MALYSRKLMLSHIGFLADGAGTLSKSSYLLCEVTGVALADGKTVATLKYSLYGSSSKSRSVTAEIYAAGTSISKTVTIGTSMKCLLTLTGTKTGYDDISDYANASFSYSVKKSGEIMESSYSITTKPDLMSTTELTYVTFASLNSYPSELTYGKSGDFQFSKSSAYKLEFYDPDGVLRYTTTFTGTSANITVPTSVFKDCGKNLTHFTFYEMNGDTAIFRDTYSVTVAETACALTLVAYRNGTSDNPDNVTLLVNGQSASVSESRTITFYAKETSATEWTKLSESLSPSSAAFSDLSCEVSLSIDYAWDIYGAIEDGYTKAQSTKVRIFSKYYIMDIRTDGTGVAFGGTAANQDELYCGFKNFRADNITPSDITGIANLIYPVGSIYMSVNSTSPATLFGGTWEPISGRFLLAAGGGYSAGDTGGEAFHTLNISEIPSHQHSGSTDSDGSHSHSYGSGKYVHLTTDGDTGAEGYSGGLSGSGYKLPRSKSSENYTHGSKTASAGSHTHSFTTGSAGGGVSHNNMPPYLVVNVWKRTA